jgi:hypothetical protein
LGKLNMAHFAELDSDNNVLRVLVFSNEHINANGGDLSIGAEQWVSTTPSTTAEESITGKPGVAWKQTSMNKNFRVNFAGVGGKYDPINDRFINRKTFPSWILQEDGTWQSPIGPAPANPLVGNNPEYSQWWDEENQRFLRFRIADAKPRTNYVWNPSNSQWEVINLDG